MPHLLLNLLEHLIVLDLEAHLVRAPPAPSDLDLFPLDLVLLVEGSQETHSNRFTDDLAPLIVENSSSILKGERGHGYQVVGLRMVREDAICLAPYLFQLPHRSPGPRNIEHF